MGASRYKTIEDAFWGRVPDKPDDDCWLWRGGMSATGYGIFSFSDKVRRPATHASIFIRDGEWPSPGLVVAHECDNPRCVRPDHLVVATHEWNVHDAFNKGRNKTGSDKSKAKLTVNQVKEICSLRETMVQREIADKYGVSQTVIQKIFAGKRYKKEVEAALCKQ